MSWRHQSQGEYEEYITVTLWLIWHVISSILLNYTYEFNPKEYIKKSIAII